MVPKPVVSGCFLEGREDAVERRAIEEPAARDDGANLPRASNVLERIRIEQHKVRNPARLNRAESASRRRNLAGSSVALCSACSGENPAATRCSSSSCRLTPGIRNGFPRSVPASTRTWARCSRPSIARCRAPASTLRGPMSGLIWSAHSVPSRAFLAEGGTYRIAGSGGSPRANFEIASKRRPSGYARPPHVPDDPALRRIWRRRSCHVSRHPPSARAQHVAGRHDAHRFVAQLRFLRRTGERQPGPVFDATQAGSNRVDDRNRNRHMSGNIDLVRRSPRTRRVSSSCTP